jgi:hypothetical protein
LDPEIGSLVAVIHPALTQSYICRAIAKKIVNEVHPYYLVVFFQPDSSPCYVPSEYVFHFKGDYESPLGEDAKFREKLLTSEISVDWLLEEIFRSAQRLVMEYSEIISRVVSTFPGDPDQMQRILFQCVSYAAILITCSICSEWKLPRAKIKLILEAVMKSNRVQFVTTSSILPRVEQIMRILPNSD